MKKSICIFIIALLLGGCGLFAPLFLQRNWGPKIENWRSTTALPEASNDFGCFESGGRLYIINSGASDYYAAIDTDGTLGDWVEIGASVSPNYRTSSVSCNGFVYSLADTTIAWAAIESDGTFGDWQYVLLPDGKFFGRMVAYQGYLYVLAGVGYEGSALVSDDTVLYATLADTGEIGDWVTATTYSFTERAEYAAVALNGYLYVICGDDVSGGTYPNDGTKSVEYAPINSDGSLGTWLETEGTFNGTFALGAVALEDGIVIIDGWSIWQEYADQADDGSLTEWGIYSPGDYEDRGRFGCVAYNGKLYVLGGYLGGSDGVFLDSVYYGDLVP